MALKSTWAARRTRIFFLFFCMRALAIAPSTSGSLFFEGSPSAEVLTQEINASLINAWRLDCSAAPLPTGYCQASPTGQAWAGTMWSRDSATHTRELIALGRFGDAKLVLKQALSLVVENAEGYDWFPQYFTGLTPASGGELDGTAGIALAAFLLWQRLPSGDPDRDLFFAWLHGPASPLRAFQATIATATAAGLPQLIASSGEFGCSCCANDGALFCFNVVSNALASTALLAGAALEAHAPGGDAALGALYLSAAAAIHAALPKFLWGNGSWVFSINTTTLQPYAPILDSAVQGVTSMLADLGALTPRTDASGAWAAELGAQTLASQLAGQAACYAANGFWSRAPATPPACLGESGAYDQGYALQAMLLLDELQLADIGLNSFAALVLNRGQRVSPYDFFEQFHWPPTPGMSQEGCGELNLVSVTEPVKAARLTLGVDDSSYGAPLRIVPRLLPSWSAIRAVNWPLRVADGLVARASINVTRSSGGDTQLCIDSGGTPLPSLSVRLWSARSAAWKWIGATNVSSICLLPE